MKNTRKNYGHWQSWDKFWSEKQGGPASCIYGGSSSVAITYKRYYHQLRSCIAGRSPRTAIEIGCGRGTFGMMLTRDGSRVNFLDNSSLAIGLTIRNFSREFGYLPATYRCDLLDWKTECRYSLVCSVGLLEHCDPITHAINAINRHLDDHGLSWHVVIKGAGAVKRYDVVPPEYVTVTIDGSNPDVEYWSWRKQ